MPGTEQRRRMGTRTRLVHLVQVYPLLAQAFCLIGAGAFTFGAGAFLQPIPAPQNAILRAPLAQVPHLKSHLRHLP